MSYLLRQEMMNQQEYVEWLFAVDQTLAQVIDQQLGTIEDEGFLNLWWNEIREGWAWRPE